MKKRKMILAVLLFLLPAMLLSACGAPAAETAGPAPETTSTVLTNDGMTLTIPAELSELVTAATPDPRDGVLFYVCEKASVEAGKKQGHGDDWGDGELFGIYRATEEEVKQMRTGDMSGTEIFAKDANGSYYIYTHPTDVRIVRDGDITEKDMEQWSKLNEWAWGSVRDAFVAENAGLEKVSFGNSEVDVCLAQIAFAGEDYRVSTTEFGPLEPKNVDPAPFLDRLMNGVTYEYFDGEAPDGEYVVLQFPDQDMRLDFCRNNIIRRAYGNESDGVCYKATFADGKTDANEVMQEWYDALKVNR